MAEMVSSAVVQETVSQMVSCFVQKNQEEELNVNRNLERLEMAHIRLEAALETSHKWQVTDASLLRWRRKLKRAAQECEGMLHKGKQRILEDKQIHEEVRNSSLPNRIVHATKSFIFSVFNCDNNELSRSVVQRFEWYADSASEFLRFVELGGTPCRNMPFDPLVKNLLAGKGLNHRIVWGTEYPSFQILLLPYNNAEHGKEASLIFIQKDGMPDGNICYSIIVQLSESTDIVGIAIKCLQLFAPHFNCTIENIRKELSQLPTQDFSWLPSICLYKKEQQGTLHSLGSVWFRPNPLCCKHGHHDFQHISNIGIAGLSDVPLEEVIEVNLQFQVSLSLCEKQKTSLTEDVISLKDSAYLKAEISFAPHGSSKAMLPANISSAVMAIVGEEQRCLHTDITFEQLEELLLPKATDYFHQNAKETAYQMIWKSIHGFAFVQVEKARMRTRRTMPGARKRKRLKQQDLEHGSWTCLISRLLDSWSVHVPVQLQSLMMDTSRKKRGIN